MAVSKIPRTPYFIIKDVTFTHDAYDLFRDNSNGIIIRQCQNTNTVISNDGVYSKFYTRLGTTTDALTLDTSKTQRTIKCLVLMNN